MQVRLSLKNKSVCHFFFYLNIKRVVENKTVNKDFKDFFITIMECLNYKLIKEKSLNIVVMILAAMIVSTVLIIPSVLAVLYVLLWQTYVLRYSPFHNSLSISSVRTVPWGRIYRTKTFTKNIFVSLVNNFFCQQEGRNKALLPSYWFNISVLTMRQEEVLFACLLFCKSDPDRELCRG